MTHWKDHKEEVTHYFHEYVEIEPLRELELLESMNSDNSYSSQNYNHYQDNISEQDYILEDKINHSGRFDEKNSRMQKTPFDVAIFSKDPKTEKYIRQTKAKDSCQESLQRGFIVAVKEIVNKHGHNEHLKSQVEKKDNQMIAYLGEDNTEIAL